MEGDLDIIQGDSHFTLIRHPVPATNKGKLKIPQK